MTATAGGLAGTGYDAPGLPTAADFWRTPQVTGGSTPDGTTDPADAIGRTGLTGIGALFNTAPPVAQLDVASGARSGVDSRTAGQPLYVTGPLSTVQGCPPGLPDGGAEFLHSNQSQGMGIGYNGLYATGSNPRVDMGFQSKGGGLFSFQTTELYPGQPYNFMDYYSNVDYALGQGWSDRFYEAGCGQRWQEYRIVDRDDGVAGPNMRLQHQGFLAGAGMANADQLRPSYNCGGVPGGFEWFIDDNRVGAGGAGFVDGIGGASGTLRNRKIVLFDSDNNDSDNFFGFGINPNTLRSQIPGIAGFFRWYARTGVCASQGVFSVSGNAVATVDPAGLAITSGQGVGELRFGGEGSTTYIKMKRSAGLNQNGLELGTSGAPAISIGGVTNARQVRMNPFGQTADTNPTYPGSASGSAQVYIDKVGTAGNDQRPLLGLTLENCGGACSQLVPPALAISNNNATDAGAVQSAGRISWFDAAKATERANIGSSQTGNLDLRTMGLTPIRMWTNNTVRMTVKGDGTLNFANVQTFASDILAGAGGLVTGDVYRTPVLLGVANLAVKV